MDPAELVRTRQIAPTRLGEELPVFCERCGYALHGAPQVRCTACSILHFACPECGHRQPINTLRPAAQRIIGRVRAAVVALWLLIKLNYFGWLMIAWGAMGAEWGYQFAHARAVAGQSNFVARPIDIEAFVAFTMFAFPYGLVSRMLLLRWRRGVLVGLVLAGIVMAAVMTGASLRWLDVGLRRGIPGPIHTEIALLAAWGGGIVVLGASVVWPIWMALAHLLLPNRTAVALLEWQRALPSRHKTREEAVNGD